MRRAWLAALAWPVLAWPILAWPVAAMAQQAHPSTSPPGAWLQRGAGELQVLDAVNAHVTAVSLKVGQSADNASISIVLRSCVVRPADQAPDAAAFLDISDKRPGAPGFHGWMFANEPAVAMLEHPIYSVRLVGCH